MPKITDRLLINKYKFKDLTKAADFISSMARKSKRTAFAYSHALDHLNRFVEQNYKPANIQTILEPLEKKQINVYKLLDSFVSYLQQESNNNLTGKSIKTYVTAIRSYLAYNDIDVIPAKFKHQVKMPSIYRENEEAIDEKDIREILLRCSNRRLKAYLLVLASGAFRAVEALAIRLRDINDGKGIGPDTPRPTKIHIRKEYAKTRVARDVYISDEATDFLKQWIDFKYRDRHAQNKKLKNRIKDENDLVFSMINSHNPVSLYVKVLVEFEKLLDVVGLNKRKEDGVFKRRKVTFHSFRRFVKTVIATKTSTDYSEWFLGHNKSPYFVMKEPERRSIYANNCMKYLTYLDYSLLEARGKGVESDLEEKTKEISALQQRDKTRDQEIQTMEKEIVELRELLERIWKRPPVKLPKRGETMEQYMVRCGYPNFKYHEDAISEEGLKKETWRRQAHD